MNQFNTLTELNGPGGQSRSTLTIVAGVLCGTLVALALTRIVPKQFEYSGIYTIGRFSPTLSLASVEEVQSAIQTEARSRPNIEFIAYRMGYLDLALKSVAKDPTAAKQNLLEVLEKVEAPYRSRFEAYLSNKKQQIQTIENEIDDLKSLIDRSRTHPVPASGAIPMADLQREFYIRQFKSNLITLEKSKSELSQAISPSEMIFFKFHESSESAKQSFPNTAVFILMGAALGGLAGATARRLQKRAGSGTSSASGK